MAENFRIDELLVKKNLASTRNEAKHLIEKGFVFSNGKLVDKASRKFPEIAKIELISKLKYVSRGGEKLEKAIEQFKINCQNSICFDAGASTGGFTDCLLQNGASSCICVDVGTNQLHKKILNDKRVFNFEKVNLKNLSQIELPFNSFDIIVCDLSFISITKIIDILWDKLKKDGNLVCLVKPQFEATKEIMDACKGVIKDETLRKQILENVILFINENLKNCELVGQINSPIKGSDGNEEFLICLKKSL